MKPGSNSPAFITPPGKLKVIFSSALREDAQNSPAPTLARPVALRKEVDPMAPWIPKVDVAAAMHHGFVSCSLDTPLATVARMMASYRVHAVLVTTHGEDASAGERHWGIVSDVALIRAAERGDKTAREAAEAPALSISADDELEHAARVFIEHEASHLIVLDPLSHRPVGVLSTLDLVRALAD